MVDDLIPAGSSPNDWDGPLEGIHRQISFMLLTTSILFALIILEFSQLSYIVMIFVFVILAMQITVWSSFKRKSKVALMPAMLNLVLSVVLFAVVSIVFISLGISGDIFYLLIGAILLFTTASCWRRLGILRDPIFQAWYNDLKIDLNSMSLDNETIVSCYSCESILAIEIQKFTLDLKCPTCNNFLVSESTKEKLTEEE